MKNKRLYSLLCAVAVTVTSVAQPVCAMEPVGIFQDSKQGADDDEMDYEVLETDKKGRNLLVRIGNVYVTSEYNDENHSSTTYYSNGSLEGESYIEKIITQEIPENEFHSVLVTTDETADGTVIEEYDKDDNLTRRVSKDGQVEVNMYDTEGNLIKQISPYLGTEEDRLHTISYEYDGDGRMVMSRVPQALNEDGSVSYQIEKYTYNENGNLISYAKNVNAIGEAETFVTTDYEYDGSRMVKMTEYDADGSILTIAQYYYDEDGNMVRQYTGLTDPLTILGLDDVVAGADTEYNVASYEYENGQLVKEGDSNGNTITYKYNEEGLLTEKTGKDGSRYEYTYRENLFRESERIFYADNDTDTPNEVREYVQESEEDGSYGMLTEIKEGDASTYYTYDENGMLTEEKDPNGNTITYEYDEDENITGISVTDKKNVPVGTTVYRYGEDGKLTGIENGDGDKIADISYDENGNVEKEAYGNGIVAEYGYYENGLPSEVVASVKAGEKQLDISYEYSVDGQMKKKTDNLSDIKTEYSYDGMGRLESETCEKDGTETTIEYMYDDASNLLEISKDGVTELENAYESGNHLEASEEGAAEYDANGNLIRLGGVAYTYDVRNRLVQVDTAEHTVCYEYDTNDKLISRSVDGEQEQFVWANDTLVAKLGETNTYYYTDLGENVKASEEGENMTYYLEENSRGDVAVLADGEGNVTGKKEYSAFGSIEDTKNNTEFAHGYTGAFYDNVTGLVYLEARFYAPEQGAFLTEDTVTGDRTDAVTLNRYIYCTQDPVNKIDRSGHWGTDRHKKISAAALAGNGYTNESMKECVNYTAGWADTYFHYKKGTEYKLLLSEQSKKRMNLSNLKGYCDQSKVNLTTGIKLNRYGTPYHGRGAYPSYLAYLMGLALQFQKGYQITNLALRNDNEMFQQMNFDTLIHLSGRYESVTGKSMTRNLYSYLILGLALHLAADLWAHVAIVDDSESVLRSFSDYFIDVDDLITALNQKVPITYLELYYFAKPGKYNTLHSELGEKGKPSALARKEVAEQSATRLVQFYKNGRIMYSGNKTLSGTSGPNTTDVLNLRSLVCPNASWVDHVYDVKNTQGWTRRIFHRYTCSSCDANSKDSCYLFFYKKTGANNGLGSRELEPGDYQ